MPKDLLPTHPHGQRLAEIFGTYRWKWIETANIHTPNWKTNEDYPLKPRVLWKRFQDMATIIGVRFGSTTRYALLDIDKDSAYLDLLPQIQGALETIGIYRTIPLRSSWSGGIHLYIPLPGPCNTFSVATALRQCLEAQGLHTAPGQLEIFPNEKAYAKRWLGEFTEYNGHRLPLQPHTGSCLLDSDLQPIGGDLAVFWALWDNAVIMNSLEEISWALATARANHRKRRRRATSAAESWREDLEAIIAEGWTGTGQTNRLLKEIATYGRVFLKLASVELYRYILKTAEGANGYAQFCGHHHDIHVRAGSWATAVEKFYWPLGDEPLRERRSLQAICEQRANDARSRIGWAVKELGDHLSHLNIKERVKLISGYVCCSASTLYKNLDLWHPEHNLAAKRVTPDYESDRAELTRVRKLVRESLESVGIGSVTRQGGENEACNVKSPLRKKLSERDERGGAGERAGLSTGWGAV